MVLQWTQNIATPAKRQRYTANSILEQLALMVFLQNVKIAQKPTTRLEQIFRIELQQGLHTKKQKMGRNLF